MASNTMQTGIRPRSPQMDILPIPKRGKNSNSTESSLTRSSPSQGKSSQADSGYGSNLPSPDQNDNRDKTKRIISFSQKAIPFPIPTQKDLLMFKKDVDPKTLSRFNEIVPEIERLLLSYLKTDSRLFPGPAKYGPMAIRLMVLGKSESDAKEHMVVLCPAVLCKRVQQFFDKQTIVQDLCEPPDPAVPSFKVVVHGQSPRLRSSCSEIRVFCEMPSQSTKDTFCGRPICLRNENGNVRFATFGGVVKVTGHGDEFKLYGLTTGHGLLEWQEDTAVEIMPSVDEDAGHGNVGNHNGFGETLLESDVNFTEKETTAVSPNEIMTSWNFAESEELGKILIAPQAATSASGECLDWALFELQNYLPNLLVTAEQSGNTRKRALGMATEIMTGGLPPRPVVMLGGSQGSKPGSFSKLPGRIMIGPTETFTDAYMLTLDSGSVHDGDSGSWVVDPITCEVYGHMVASDMFGDAYIIPMASILGDIKKHLRAESVELPSTIDFSIVALNKNLPQDASNLAIELSSQHDLNVEPSFIDHPSFVVDGEFDNMTSLDWTTSIEWPQTVIAGYEEPPAPTTLNDIPSGLNSPIEQSTDSTDSGYHTLNTTPSGPSPQTSPPKRLYPISMDSTPKRAIDFIEEARRQRSKKIKLSFDLSRETGPRTPEQ